MKTTIQLKYPDVFDVKLYTSSRSAIKMATKAATTLLPHRVENLSSLDDEQFLLELDKLTWQILETYNQITRKLDIIVEKERKKTEPARIKKLQDDVADLEKRRNEMPAWKSPSHV